MKFLLNSIRHSQLKVNAQMDKNPLWNFSLIHYAKKPVQELCLELQEQADANVNLLLFALWLAAENRQFLPDTILADETYCAWHQQVVLPLRQVRYATKLLQGRAELYESLKKDELEAERVEQNRLVALLPRFECAQDIGGQQLALQNVRAYLQTLPILDDQTNHYATALVTAVFSS